jgi:hypothetical protein
MPIVNGAFVLPGVFSQIQANLLPTAPGGIRIPALVGTGRTTNLASNEEVTRGGTAYDALAHTATSLASTIQDENFVLYDNGIDYQLGTGGNAGKVEWLTLAASLTGTEADTYDLSGNDKTFELAVANGSVQTYTFVDGNFSVPSAATAAEVKTAILANFTGVTNTTNIAATAATGFYTVVDYTALAGDTVTVAGHVLTNGAEWTAAVSNPATATSLASAINALSEVSAVAVGAVVNITATPSGRSGNAVTLATSDATNLPKSGVTLTGGSDYVKIATTDTVNSSLYIGAGTANSLLGFTSGSFVETPDAPATGVNYFVTYEYAKVTADYTPKFYFTLQSVVNDYGPVSNSTSISLGASLAFQNGASIVCVIQQDPDDGSVFAQVQNSLNKLLSTANISIVVSLAGTANAQLLAVIKNHVDTASSTINKLERTTIVGLEGTYTDQDMLGFASSVSDKRVVLLNNSTVTNKLFIGTDTTETVVGSQFVAAALAGVRCNPSFDVAQPMTREVISGFTSITNTLTQAEKSLLINQGVCVVDTIQAVPKVLFGTTTAFDTIANQLYQVTQIMDFVAQSLRGLLDPIFIGQKLLKDTPFQIQTVTSAILQTIQNDTIIIAFTTPSATVDSVVPTQVNLSVGVQPTLETDTIIITLGLNLV